MSEAKRLRIGLYGPYSSHNLGDTAIQMAVMSNLRDRNPSIDFLGICSDPEDVVRTHRIPAFSMSGEMAEELTLETSAARRPVVLAGRMASAWRKLTKPLRRIRNVYRCVGRFDALLISGGGQLDDFWGGPWGSAYELLLWTALCRLRGRRVLVFAIGVDNLTTWLGRGFAFMAMRLAHYSVYRDHWTLETLQRAGVSLDSHVCPDPAFSLDLVGAASPGRKRSADARDDRRSVVVICPISERAWRHREEASYVRYLDELIATCERLIEQGRFVRLSNSQVKMDIPLVETVAKQLADRVGAAGSTWDVMTARTVGEYVQVASEADVVVASRLHGVMLPIVAGTPAVAISYMRKVSQLMVDLDMAEHNVALTGVSADALVGMVEKLIDEAPRVRERIVTLNAKLRRELYVEYDALLRYAQGG